MAAPTSPAVGDPGTAFWADSVAGEFATAATPAAWTPTWGSSGTAPAIGNGTRQGSYVQIEKLLFAQGSFTLGSTSTVGTGFYQFSVPINLNASYVLSAPVGWLSFADTSAGLTYTRTLVRFTASLVIALDPSGVPFGAASPAVPANTDQFLLTLNYFTT